MWKPEWTVKLILGAVVALLLGGIFGLMDASVATGDVYPGFSSLRAGPDGSKVLYESLSRLPPFDTARAFKPVKASVKQRAAILEIGAPFLSFNTKSPERLRDWERLADAGNRVIIALDLPPWIKQDPKLSEAKVWGVLVKVSEKEGTVYFAECPGWSVIDGPAASPTGIERSFGSGSIVLMGSPDPFLNSTLAGEHDSGLLLRAIGNYRRVIFEEAHLGVRDSGSVLGLARRYHLTGLLLGLMLLALVFIWSKGAQFPPPAMRTGSQVVGHDFQSGFLQLLRKHVPRGALIQTCVAEWQRSHPRARVPEFSSKLDVLAAYAAIQKDLTRK